MSGGEADVVILWTSTPVQGQAKRATVLHASFQSHPQGHSGMCQLTNPENLKGAARLKCESRFPSSQVTLSPRYRGLSIGIGCFLESLYVRMEGQKET